MEVEGAPDTAVDGAVGSDPAQHSEGWSVSRRILLKAGWSVPMILTVAPSVAFAASGAPLVTGLGGATASGGTPPSTASGGTPPSTAGGGTSPSTAGGGSPSGIPEQQSQGPQPARIKRGFTD